MRRISATFRVPSCGFRIPAPYFSFALDDWVPCVVTWEAETGAFWRVEGPDAFTTWNEAEEASRFLRFALREAVREECG